MSGWVRLPATWLERDDVEELAADAVLVHLSALSYSCRQQSDGFVAHRALRRLWPATDMDAAVHALEKANEWEQVDGGWLLVNWRDHLLAADEVERRRQQSAESTERWRRHKDGDHSKCSRCSVIRSRDGSRDASPQKSVTTLGTARHGTARSAVPVPVQSDGPVDAAAPLGHAGEAAWPESWQQTRDHHQFYGPEGGLCTRDCQRPHSDERHRR